MYIVHHHKAQSNVDAQKGYASEDYQKHRHEKDSRKHYTSRGDDRRNDAFTHRIHSDEKLAINPKYVHHGVYLPQENRPESDRYPGYHLQKHRHDHRRSHNHYHQHRRSHDEYYPHNYVHHDPHIHVVSARSEPPLKLSSNYQVQPMEVTFLKDPHDPPSAPRIALLDKRSSIYSNGHPHGHVVVEKSSKAIPSMHYDELRCPHCAAHVQPSQDEALAYPWTVQSFRPRRKTELPEVNNDFTTSDPGVRVPTLPEPTQVNATNVDGSVLEPTFPLTPQRSAAPASLAPSYRAGRNSVVTGGDFSEIRPLRDRRSEVATKIQTLRGRESEAATKENLVAPSEPIFRSSNVLHRSSRYNTRQLRPINELPVERRTAYRTEEDDVSPYDSVSNVETMTNRAYTIEYMANDYKRPRYEHARAEPELVKSDPAYPRKKFFRSMEEEREGRRTTKMPAPHNKDTASHISRMLKGEYYNRSDGQKYEYDINMDQRNLRGSLRRAP